MENMEEILMELNHFANRKAPPDSLPDILEDYLVFVAKTGTTYFPWPKIKPLFRAKLQNVMTEFSPNPESEEFPAVPNVDQFSFSACKDKVFQQLDCFNGIPFTVQRLCELLTAPKKHYKRTDKFMRALEKNMLVVSTVEPQFARRSSPEEEQNDRKSTNNIQGMTDLSKVNGSHDHKEEDEDENDPDSDTDPAPKPSTPTPTASDEPSSNNDEKKDDEASNSPSASLDSEDSSGPCDSGRAAQGEGQEVKGEPMKDSAASSSQDESEKPKVEAEADPTEDSDSMMSADGGEEDSSTGEDQAERVSGSEEVTGPCDSAANSASDSSETAAATLDSSSSATCPSTSSPSLTTDSTPSSQACSSAENGVAASTESESTATESSDKGPCDSEETEKSEAAPSETKTASNPPESLEDKSSECSAEVVPMEQS